MKQGGIFHITEVSTFYKLKNMDLGPVSLAPIFLMKFLAMPAGSLIRKAIFVFKCLQTRALPLLIIFPTNSLKATKIMMSA